MCCGRTNCLGKTDFSAMMQKKKEEKRGGILSGQKKDFTGDFKIALAAMTSAEDFQALQEYFMSGKE